MRFGVGVGGQLAALMLSALLALTACERPPPPVLAPLDAPGALQPAAPRVNSALGEDRARLPVFESRAVGKAPAVPLPVSSGSGQDGDVTLNFVDTDIREIVRTILGATLNLNYTIDPSVQGTGTLEVGNPAAAFGVAADTRNLAQPERRDTELPGRGLRVVALGRRRDPQYRGRAGGSRHRGRRSCRLRYASAKDLAKVLEPYVAEGGKITADPGRNALIVSGDAAVRQTLVGLIRAFDIDRWPVNPMPCFRSATKTRKSAPRTRKGSCRRNDGALAGIVRVVPMERVNAVLVVSAQPRYIDAARRFFRLERRVEDATRAAGTSITCRTGRAPISKTCCSGRSRRAM